MRTRELMNMNSVMLQNRDEANKRDYLYYLAIGNTKLKEYSTALKYVRALLQVEPGNRQAQVRCGIFHWSRQKRFKKTKRMNRWTIVFQKELEAIVSRRLEKDGMVGMAVAGGAAVALGGLVGLGLAFAGRQMMKK